MEQRQTERRQMGQRRTEQRKTEQRRRRPMKIAKFENLHCDAGWRTFSFLKVTTDDGLIGWSEYTEGDGSRGLTSIIHGMAEALIGMDPRPAQAISSLLYIRHQQAAHGVNQRAMAAIENALLDLKGKALG